MGNKLKSVVAPLALSAALHLGLGSLIPQSEPKQTKPIQKVEQQINPKAPEKKEFTTEEIKELTPISDKQEERFLFPKRAEPKKEYQIPVVHEDLYTPPQGEKKVQIQEEINLEKYSPFLTQVEDKRPKEPVTLEGILKARERFQKTLLKDMKDDPEGKVKLQSMPFIEFLVKGWYYNYGIDRLTHNKPLEVKPPELYKRFDQMMAVAKARIRKDQSALQKDMLFHDAMFTFLKGYERDTRDVKSALKDGIIDCDSGTQVGVAGYRELDPDVLLNVYLDHIQAATKEKAEVVVIENTTPKQIVLKHSSGFLVKPEAYVVGYLLNNSTLSLDDFPKEIQGWYDYPFPNLFGLRQPLTGLPLSLDLKTIKKPEAGLKPFDEKPSFSTAVTVLEDPEIDLTQRGSGISQQTVDALPSVSDEIAQEIDASKMYLEMLDTAAIAADAKKTVKTFFSPVKVLTDEGEGYADFAQSRTLYEEQGIFDENQALPKERVIPKKPVLAKELRDANSAKLRIGLLEDLKADKPGLLAVTSPQADWCKISQEIADNKVLLYGNDLASQVQGLQKRKLALERANFFSLLKCNDLQKVEKRISALEAVLEGKWIENGRELFSSHSGYKQDPLVDLKEMIESRAEKGVSLAAIEDLISFKREKETVKDIFSYLKRKELELDRVEAGKLLISVRDRVLDKDSFDSVALDFVKQPVHPSLAVAAATAQVLFKYGKRDPSISSALQAYLLNKTDSSKEEILNLVETGLGKKSGEAVLRTNFKDALDDLKKISNSNFKKTVRSMVNSYQALTTLGDDSAAESLYAEWKNQFGPQVHVLLPEEDLVNLLIKEGKHVEDILTEYVKLAKEGKGTYPPQLIRFLVENGQRERAVKMIEEVLIPVFPYRERLIAAATLHSLGKPQEAKSALTDLLTESNVFLWKEQLRRMEEEEKEQVKGVQTLRPLKKSRPVPREYNALGPLHLLTEFGVTPQEQEKIAELAQRGALDFGDPYSAQKPLHVFEGENGLEKYKQYIKPQYRKFLEKQDQKALLAEGNLRILSKLIFNREAYDVMKPEVAEYEQDLYKLGLLPLVRQGKGGLYHSGADMWNLLAGKINPKVQEVFKKNGNEEDLARRRQILDFYFATGGLSSERVNLLLECANREREIMMIDNNRDDCLKKLVIEGYLDTDSKGEVIFKNPPVIPYKK